MADTYLPGWVGARIAFWDGTVYSPIACITSRSESNASRLKEKTNVCTEGQTVKTVVGIDSTVSVSGEVVDTDSLEELRALQDSKSEHTFRVYRGTGETNPVYFNAIITNLNADYSAGQDEDATFTMDLQINEDGYLDTDPHAAPLKT